MNGKRKVERMIMRQMVKIDEEKCNGCGLCVPACVEGALQIVDGKARLISDKYCDGLGACLGECPQGAITIEERNAEEFDEEAVKMNLKRRHSVSPPINLACPSAHIMRFEPHKSAERKVKARIESELSQWPVQLTLLPPNAPFFENADLLIAADCVPFAYANFHQDFLKGKTLVIGCPKLDKAEAYRVKLTEIFRRNNIRSITVANMEVPCCFGLFHVVKRALEDSGKEISIRQETISIKGEKLSANTRQALPWVKEH